MNNTKKISFLTLPKTFSDFTKLKEASLNDPYEVAALVLLALSVYPENNEEAYKMLDYLKGPKSLNEYDKQFLKDRFRGKEYLMNSYFDGATPENNYTPTTPYTISIIENIYSKVQINDGYITLYVNCNGADSPRPLKLRNKPSTGQWFLWEQSLLTGIRTPKDKDDWA